MRDKRKIGLVTSDMDAVCRILGKYKHRSIKGGRKTILCYEHNVLDDLSKRFLYQFRLGVCPCKIGELSAASSTQFLIDNYKPDLVINFGMAHRVNLSGRTDLIYLVKSVVHYDFDVSEARDEHIPGAYPEYRDYHIPTENSYFKRVLEKHKTMQTVICASGDKFITKSNSKGTLLEEFHDVEICDMSAAGVLLTAAENKIPCVILKGLTDGWHNGTVFEDDCFNRDSAACFQEALYILNSLFSH